MRSSSGLAWSSQRTKALHSSLSTRPSRCQGQWTGQLYDHVDRRADERGAKQCREFPGRRNARLRPATAAAQAAHGTNRGLRHGRSPLQTQKGNDTSPGRGSGVPQSGCRRRRSGEPGGRSGAPAQGRGVHRADGVMGREGPMPKQWALRSMWKAGPSVDQLFVGNERRPGAAEGNAGSVRRFRDMTTPRGGRFKGRSRLRTPRCRAPRTSPGADDGSG